jgi:hypothetical protein
VIYVKTRDSPKTTHRVNQFFSATHHPPLAFHRLGAINDYLPLSGCKILIPGDVVIAQVIYLYTPLRIAKIKRYIMVRYSICKVPLSQHRRARLEAIGIILEDFDDWATLGWTKRKANVKFQ